MNELTAVLDRFNRKERNLLIRDCLGHAPSDPLLLTDDFRTRIGTALGGLKIPKDAWWATDYHLNWIAGALVIWRCGEQAIGKDQINVPSDIPVRWLVERSQEDADLLIVFDTTLILVEVKAFGYFTNRQIESKLNRWRLLKRQSEFPGSEVTFHFMLMSRTEPTGLHPPPNDLLACCPKWTHALLRVDSPLQKLKVSGRRPGTDAPPPNLEKWFILPFSRNTDDDDKDDELSPPT